MKFTSTIAAIALVAGASAQQAIVHNNCQDTVYVQSFPYDGSATGPLTTLQAGQTFSEDFRKSGSTVKVSKTKTLTSPLFIGYSFSSNPDYGYYELSSEWGNPFADKRVTLSPGAGCQAFNCAPNDAGCYSRPDMKKVYGCPLPINVEATLCA
ncbi:hypothetical protein MCOR27_009796 [Pyricularia oryzae]|uniref:Uncharacterized protein n=2 Tax=Pyricularia TaxID=48558 RepID=A0ABQ8N9Z3_PYRGI|nr:hypothetical protein MCOR01_006211 [Pyricularia oryzae]KAI6293681.1 hypothetical protein MCOR33_008971 [Pyricularia grisea]KAH8842294.1 hypothetical protein MCOR01_006211 [Pyricularia oryzae]KAH8842295.1 hypothetical protein MCOR01_006211 [Pyricularia oryzae]KAI6254186.1 hypothetical protein MCOR19_009275 [Pyricularia oryzae]